MYLAALLESTIWGNAQIFLPVMITLTGGYLINREYTDINLKKHSDGAGFLPQIPLGEKPADLRASLP